MIKVSEEQASPIDTMESDRLRPKEPVKAALHLKTSALEKGNLKSKK